MQQLKVLLSTLLVAGRGELVRVLDVVFVLHVQRSRLFGFCDEVNCNDKKFDLLVQLASSASLKNKIQQSSSIRFHFISHFFLFTTSAGDCGESG